VDKYGFSRPKPGLNVSKLVKNEKYAKGPNKKLKIGQNKPIVIDAS
jgi:hypothetical protein